MSTVKTKRKRQPKTKKVAKRRSFRDLKAFGLWAGREDIQDPVEFTTKLRGQMEHGKDSK